MIYNKEIEAKKNKEALLALMTMRAWIAFAPDVKNSSDNLTSQIVYGLSDRKCANQNIEEALLAGRQRGTQISRLSDW